MQSPSKGYLSLTAILYIAAFAVVIAALVGIYMKGRHDEGAERDAEAAEAKRQRYEMVSALALDLAAEREKRLAQSLARERELKELRDGYAKQLANYVPRTPDSAQCIRAGFVRYLDAAARGVPLGPAIERDVALAPAGIENDEAAAVIEHNYGLYHDCKARVEQLITEYDSVAATINKAVGTFKKE